MRRHHEAASGRGVVLIAAVVALAVAACGGAAGSTQEAVPGSQPPAFIGTTPAATSDGRPTPDPNAPASGLSVTLVAEQPAGKDVGFDLDAIEAPAGQTFEIELDNRDEVAKHDFAVLREGESVSKVIFKSELLAPLTAATITVPGLPAGSYEFVCSLHSSLMRGTLTIE